MFFFFSSFFSPFLPFVSSFPSLFPSFIYFFDFFPSLSFIHSFLPFLPSLSLFPCVRPSLLLSCPSRQRWRNAASQAGEDEKQRAQRQLDLAREEEEKDLLDALTKLVLGSQVRYLWTQKTAAFERAWAKFAQEQLRASEIQARNWESALDLIQDNSAAHTGPLLHAGDLENPNQQQQDQKSFSSAAAEQHYPDFVESSQESSNSPVAGDGVVDDGDDDGRGSGKAGILSKEYRNSDAVIETPAPDGDDPGGEEEEEEEEEIVFGGGLLGEGEEDDQLFRPVQEQGKDGEGPEDGIEVDF